MLTKVIKDWTIKHFPEIKNIILSGSFPYLEKAFQEICRKGLRNRVYGLKDIPGRWAYFWALEYPEDKNDMKQFINTSEEAYDWACAFPEDKEELKQFVTESGWAYYWARRFLEDKEEMKPFVAESEWVHNWNNKFPEDQIEKENTIKSKLTKDFITEIDNLCRCAQAITVAQPSTIGAIAEELLVCVDKVSSILRSQCEVIDY